MRACVGVGTSGCPLGENALYGGIMSATPSYPSGTGSAREVLKTWDREGSNHMSLPVSGRQGSELRQAKEKQKRNKM